MLDGKNCQGVVVEVQSLVVRENDFVDTKLERICDATVDEIDDVQSVILERTAPSLKSEIPSNFAQRFNYNTHRRNRLVVCVKFIEMRSQLIGDENRCPNNHMATVVAEQTTLPVELLFTSVQIHDMLQLEESLEDFASDVIPPVFVDVRHHLFSPILSDEV